MQPNNPMQQSRLKACEPCKSSKRKCTKQLPQCRRCELRGLHCSYESRPRMVVYQPDNDAGRLVRLPQNHGEQDIPYLPQYHSPATIAIDPELELQLSEASASACPSLDDLRSAWFLTPESWKISPVDPSRLSPISVAEVDSSFDRIKDWLKDWAETGSNPFVHHELYKKVMPSCVQDAFMALSTYLSKTDKTSDIINRLIEDKAKRLVEVQGSEEVSLLDEIGRVQSLMIYTFIRLFDGDIRQRHFAEQHLPILHDWTKQMFRHTSYATSDDTLLLHNALTIYTPQLTSNPPIPCQSSPEQVLWHAWILSESVRRTWCISMMIQAGYELLKTGTGPCYGALQITTRRGVWDAETASAWTEICAERSVGFLHRNGTEGLMTESRMDEVDVFPLAFMELDFGPERMKRWQLVS
ncbi:hypothetical protein FZEAL_2789 [Fusarium zealandicum]|uniref:Zn(2)-C6 fungal-type domain-containing protein n=1 Tax=Fusarium zealandicum TaxID=1053134 RepID=A0A8H4UQU0_9HYPO|nr:hypothetical protein FZEAL_2789 [Fusarium zealandicum]